jgi:dephospho-CoA kinase
MIVVGLTGGIASGKSTVARIFQQAGAVVIDADRIAREVVAPGLPAWQEIRAAFGPDVLQPDGKIDREALARIVFASQNQRRRLERIIHPRVGTEMAAQLARAERQDPAAVVLLDIPLLFETGRTDGLAEIIVVYVPDTLQCERLMHRDRLSEADARARMDAQIAIDEKVKKATIVIDNSGSLADTEKQTLAVFQRLARQAGRKN